MISGIYKITNLVNKKFYIGSAVNFKIRFSTHISELNSNTHSNKHLQNAWNKYGKENFLFEILESVENKENLLLREQYYFDTLNPEYNICKKAGNNLGIKYSEESRKKISENHADVSGENNPMYGKKGELSPNYGKIHTEETKEKIRLGIGDRSGKNNPMHGKKHSPETIKKMRMSSTQRNSLSKLNWDDIRKIRAMHKEKLAIKEIAATFKVSASNIRMIVKNITWKE